METDMTLFDKTGLWTIWYSVMWLVVLPFVYMLLWTVVRVSRARSGEESTWLNGAVLGAFFALIITTFLATLLYVKALPMREWYTYLAWLAVHFVTWTFVGSGVFFASLQALAAGPRIGMRRTAALLAVLGVTILHVAQLYATWRFRTR